MAPDSYSLSPLQSSLSRKDCLAGSWTIQLVQTALILFLLLCFGCLTCPFIKAAGRHLSLSLFAGCLVKRQAWCQVHCFLMPLKLQVLTKGFLSPLYAGSASACVQKPASSQTISPPVRCQLNTMVLLIPFNSPLLRQNNNSKMPSFYCDPPPNPTLTSVHVSRPPKSQGLTPTSSVSQAESLCGLGWSTLLTPSREQKSHCCLQCQLSSSHISPTHVLIQLNDVAETKLWLKSLCTVLHLLPGEHH